jgi:hypothetical protein
MVLKIPARPAIRKGNSNEDSKLQERNAGFGIATKGNEIEVYISEIGICPRKKAVKYPARIPIKAGYSFMEPFPHILTITITPRVTVAMTRFSYRNTLFWLSIPRKL